VRAAAELRLAAVAITDHDTLSALSVGRSEAERLGIELVGGIELTAELDGREIHILGHFVNDSDPHLLAATSTLREAREARLDAMAERLVQLGLNLEIDALKRAFPRAILGRRHLADWLATTGQVASRREAFARFLGENGPVQVAKLRLPWSEAIALVRGAGGVAGLAHPPYNLRECTLQKLVAGGLGSLEVAGPGTDARRTSRLRAWAEKLGSVPIAGSDFHAPDRPGCWVGAITTPASDLERLRSAARDSHANAIPSFLASRTQEPVASWL